MRGSLRDDKVVQPVGGGHEDLGNGAGSTVKRLSSEDPRDRIVAKRVKGGPDVKEDEGASTRPIERLLLVDSRLGDGDVGSDVVHGESTTGCGDHQKTATANSLNEDENEEKGTDGLDDTKDTGGQETSVGADDTERLEHGGGVVVDGVDSRAVLESEERRSKG